ncbi:hypothetical protein JOD55_000159 [Arcanobacterium pluranimalium]|uniref:hypothetical protein n=1 Tax=Arcanobacterium pluranimalium TaxID=108028 RepID=UPI0019589523|nr:hypothetical protein [Arcanobacterium pluranimalium]MBM7824332.1 hypothetical protein [Arcanobacterium pluranimalium]
MKIRKITSGIIGIALAISLMSCSHNSQIGQSRDNNLDIKADIDKEHYSITLPSERFAYVKPFSQEFYTFEAARTAAVAYCARTELGIPWIGAAPGTFSGKPPAFTEFGPWTVQMASIYAFENPSIYHPATKHLNKPSDPNAKDPLIYNSRIPEKDIEKMGPYCHEKEYVKQFDPEFLAPHGPWIAELNDTRNQLFKDERAKAIIDELKQCFSEAGLKMYPGHPGYVEGADVDRIDANTIQLAIKAAECQEKLNATPRLVEIWAELQAPIITKYADELIAQRQKIDKAVADAKEYINAHPELFEPPK